MKRSTPALAAAAIAAAALRRLADGQPAAPVAAPNAVQPAAFAAPRSGATRWR